ncbi:MAG: glutathione synthase [Actinomycetota bacterium]|nr:glutathione synthase [Actinomycetota bacterium]
MRIAFLVSDIDTEQPDYATTRFAVGASDRGHDTFYLDLDGVSYSPDEQLTARVRRVPIGNELPYDSFLERIQRDTDPEAIDVGELDVLMLRHEPELTMLERPWTPTLGISIGELAAERGVLVLNDPTGFARASSKLYLQGFPPEVRPQTLITRGEDEARAFIDSLGGRAVVKPLQSGKGRGVFLVRPDEDANVNQMIEAVKRDGYIVVQEYLTAAGDGDRRLLMMNGEPLRVDGTYAAIFRRAPADDLRANISLEGSAEPAEIDDDALRIAAAVKPKLVRDGMFLVGLDIAGDKLIEVNGTSPGTFTSSQWVTGVDYAAAVIEAIEKKVAAIAGSRSFDNRELATAVL